MPHTALTRFDLFAVTKGVAGGIVARAAVVGDDHPDVPDRDQRFGFDLNRAEPAINEKGAIGQHL